MRKGLFSIVLLIAICMMGCESNRLKSATNGDTLSIDPVVSYSVQDAESAYSLNDIRFNNFTDEDWLDNEYFRSLRKYLDDFNSGKIEDGRLEPYKENVRGNFVIGAVEPALLGGLIIRFMFIDNPDDVFFSWVYGSVDEETKTIIDYSVRGINLDEFKSGLTKDDVLQLLKEHPEQSKVW